MESKKIEGLIKVLSGEKAEIVNTLKNSGTSEISDIKVAKKFIDEVFISRLREISQELDTVINEDKINKMLAE